MNAKSILCTALVVVALIGCNTKEKEDTAILSPGEYDPFLAVQKQYKTSRFFELWNNKITSDSIELLSLGNVAGQYGHFFGSTGDIDYLKKAEAALTQAVKIANVGKSGYYRSLAANYISQHRFKEALVYADSAHALGPNLPENQHLLFDVQMELGHYKKADSLMRLFADPQDFSYIIRASKWNDHIGKLDTTIMFMEKAQEKADEGKNKTLQAWVYSNLGDYYGHAGRIQDSYNEFIKTLAIDSSNAHVKKGLAWMAYSHDKNPKEANRILDSVIKGYVSPDYYLLKSEFSAYDGDQKNADRFMEKFYSLSSNPSYGNMYNAYLIEAYLSDPSKYAMALDLAKKEIANRATPHSYELLAWAELQNGNKEAALKIVQDYVDGQTFEPKAQLTMAKVYKANGMEEKVKPLKEELMGAAYELGPMTMKEVERL